MENDAKYIQAAKSGLLQEKICQASKMLQSCTLCPRKCKVNRDENEKGYCGGAKLVRLYSYAPHFGEEPELTCTNGSGTIFFSNCSLRCCFCQNHDISIEGKGIDAEKGQLASVMLELQQRGCHNINLVTPAHYVPQFLEELLIAVENGLNLPIVYNSSGYESIKTLSLLEDIIDIFMPDFKFWDPKASKRFCNAPDYPEITRKAIKEMYRQVGDLVVDDHGIAKQGLLVRHLVMPDDVAGTDKIFQFLSRDISSTSRVNVMSQYHPAGSAHDHADISRPVSPTEYRKAIAYARKHRLIKGTRY